VAGQTNLGVALDIDGFVFAPSAAKAMEGRQLSVQGPPSSGSGAASEEDEIGVAAGPNKDFPFSLRYLCLLLLNFFGASSSVCSWKN